MRSGGASAMSPGTPSGQSSMTRGGGSTRGAVEGGDGGGAGAASTQALATFAPGRAGVDDAFASMHGLAARTCARAPQATRTSAHAASFFIDGSLARGAIGGRAFGL